MDEKIFRDIFEKQLVIWEDLIFNRPIAYHLTAADWWNIRVLSFFTYLMVAGVIIIIPILFFYGMVFLASNFITSYVDPFLTWIGGITEFDDQMKLLTVVVTVSAFLATQFRKVASWLRELYPRIYNWFFISTLLQRTYVPWHEKSKPLHKIWWRRIRTGDN